MSQPQPSAAQQLAGAQQQLLNAYVQREQARKQLEQIDTQIAAFTNLLAGVELGQRAAGEAVPQPVVIPALPPLEPGLGVVTDGPPHPRAVRSLTRHDFE